MPFPIIVFRVPVPSSLCEMALTLRHTVFVNEQNVPPELERDEHDLTASHFVAVLDGEVAGTLRVLDFPEHAKIGRVAVLRHYRGRGVARAMMLAAMAAARDAGQPRLYLTAQTDKLGLYEKLGFTAFGPVFDDAGMPHRAMRNYEP
ncbi:GNAT family N-acetyltransferase [uncultured Devosia sp.]|uniref:GNAT family N-acetyltransferase n=1 Tax=uncultured Devosia sp. TaxID=211434 RepID=UPI0035CC1722